MIIIIINHYNHNYPSLDRMYVLVIPQNEYGILVITRDRGKAEVEC